MPAVRRKKKNKGGRPRKCQDPVDKSIRLESGEWGEIADLCPKSYDRFASWSDRVRYVLDLLRDESIKDALGELKREREA